MTMASQEAPVGSETAASDDIKVSLVKVDV